MKLANPGYRIRTEVFPRDENGRATGPAVVVKEATSYWFDNAVATARHDSRIEGGLAIVTHPHTDLRYAVTAEGREGGGLSAYFDPCECGCGLPICKATGKPRREIHELGEAVTR